MCEYSQSTAIELGFLAMQFNFVVSTNRAVRLWKKLGCYDFVHGCFWHGHDCTKGRAAKSRTEYWIPKIEDCMVCEAISVLTVEAVTAIIGRRGYELHQAMQRAVLRAA